MPTFVDLSHPLEDGMAAYPGLPPARIEAILDHEASRERYAGKAEFFLGRVELSCNTGTYVDAPFHRYPDREDLARLAIERLAGLPGVVVDARPAAGPVSLPADVDVAGRAVLIRTGWDRRWGTPDYYEPGPFLGQDAIERLLDAALVGVDFANVDDTDDPARPAHTRLLGAGIPLVEHLRGLADLPSTGFRFTAVPPAIVRGASFPVRAFAELP